MNAADAQDTAGTPTVRDPGSRAPLAIASASLFHGYREVVILHGGQEYRLRITRADKLILTK